MALAVFVPCAAGRCESRVDRPRWARRRKLETFRRIDKRGREEQTGTNKHTKKGVYQFVNTKKKLNFYF